MNRTDKLSTSTGMRETSEGSIADRSTSSAICSKARMQQCDLPPSGGQVNEGEWGYSGYIWGVSLIKRTSLSPVAYQGWKIGEERG